ncbi:hypothetical protein CEE37_12430 [candidate division LCP-89 bacterium B3_LCP]|uniref:UDP-N-acetylmuramate:L-alanyl-gamma-D-glutamyl-meso-diaminopimelate ligase n=1 Tax=candidate division LCP-89 bacterium B3_LCP TaxID=2012998 RepID=A0A532UUD8_UNCL8|nr:MAG: hypothetical protein CEE37_12430 [candidate division LCP-89 bacterium B3_LCP]
MAQVAAGLKDIGHQIRGSDQGVYPPMSDFLGSRGIKILTPFHEANINPADTVVIGNALSRGNPEVEAVLEKRFPYLSLPELIRIEILTKKLPAVITGTHGKTTTSAILTHIFEHAGLQPGYMIGGLPVGKETGFATGSGKWFVIEGDEYDCAFFDKRPKFLHYRPHIAVVNNVEFDHADIYSSYDEIVLQFQRLVKLVPQSGCLILNGDWTGLDTLRKDALCNVVTFGRGTNIDVQSELIKVSSKGMEFALNYTSGDREICTTSLWGEHQLANITGAAAAAEFAGISPAMIGEAISSFKGVQRRLELKYRDDKFWLYDDFAHHPTAVAAALRSVKSRHPGLPVIAAFEPRSNTMTRRVLQNEIAAALELADFVAIGGVHRSEIIPENDRLDVENVADHLINAGKTTIYSSDVNQLADWIVEKSADEAVIVTMSSGSFQGIVPLIRNRLEKLRNSVVH